MRSKKVPKGKYYVELKYYDNGKMQIKVPEVKGEVPGWIQFPVAVAILMKKPDKDFSKLVWRKWKQITKLVKKEEKKKDE